MYTIVFILVHRRSIACTLELCSDSVRIVHHLLSANVDNPLIEKNVLTQIKPYSFVSFRVIL